MEPISLEIYTKKGIYLKGEVISIDFTSSSGDLGILPFHAPLIACVSVSPLKLKFRTGEIFYYAIANGIFTLSENKATFLLDSIERSDEIDVSRANSSKERAMKRLENKLSNLDIKRAELSLKKAINRISVSSYK